MATDIFILQDDSELNPNIVINDVSILQEDTVDNSINDSCEYDNVSPGPAPVVINIPENVENSCESGDSHNDLSNLQGGRTGERYHLTKDQNEAISNANNPSIDNKFLTENDVVNLSGSLNLYRINGGNAFGNNFHSSEQ